MTVLSIARTALRRLFRDRSNIFFVFVLPIALVLLIGAQFVKPYVKSNKNDAADAEAIYRAAY